MSQLSKGEIVFTAQLSAADYPLDEFVTEYVFAPPRRWRFDFAYPSGLIAIEIEGGSWIKGRHNYGAGFENDMRKYNTGESLGWIIFRFTPHMVFTGEALAFLKSYFEKDRKVEA